MKRISTSIIIQASPQAVWQVLMAFDQYKEWNPFIRSVQGQPILGTQLVNTLAMSESSTQIFKPTITALEPNKTFKWLGRLFLPGLFDGEHCFYLEAQGSNQTRLIHEENFSGLLSGIVLKMKGEEIKANFEKMNVALKQRVEHNYIIPQKNTVHL